ncbi:hypothetical protein BDU57DRAFT_342071 [Ampelomyces quisqualis]|uniref:Homeodomain-like protein n=1 Tax=Ampelomyces quisqualis TaxID=50730 RepID=A0A6A5QCC3_AMPQU|nr:hypothetical protein BDU57DRAFT_342071 [Ampelomyces quisqualis]
MEPSRQRRNWTIIEDQMLREQVEAQVIECGDVKDWCKVAASLPGRTNKDCRKRWHNSVMGVFKKGKWSKDEDGLLARGVQEHGQKWTLVAACVESRSADQCAKRWQQSLDPDLDHSEWRDEEDRILIEATQQLGRHWKDIQREHFPGRSKNTIKNRYTVLVRRYQNQGITLPSRASSPSQSSSIASLSNSTPDDEYTYHNLSIDNNLMPPPHTGTSASIHRSWSSLDSKAAVSAWSNPHAYELPMALPHHQDMTHATNTILNYAYAPPRTNISHSTTPHDWATLPSSSPMDAPMQARSPVSYSTSPAPLQQHYYDYTTAQPFMSSNGRPYSRSPARASCPGMLPNTIPTSTPRARAWSGQQGYASLAPTKYPDPRLQQNPVYRF